MTSRLPPREQRDYLKIGELAEEFQTTPRTIRLYEELGLIVAKRTEGGTRLYQRKDAKRLRMALRLARLGLELSEIQKLASTRETCQSGAEAQAKIQPLLEDLKAWVDTATADLAALKTDLAQAEALILQCRHCPNPPNRKACPDCPVDSNLDKTDLARLIWDPESP